jgi:hypothetical protein
LLSARHPDRSLQSPGIGRADDTTMTRMSPAAPNIA